MSNFSYKLGALDPRRPVGLADLACYLHDPLPEGPAEIEAPTANWGMLGNDQYGDCTFAGLVHLRMANAVEHDQTEQWPDTDQVVQAYLQQTGGQDTGCVEADVLKTWQTAGLLGNKIDGYAPGDHRNEDELRSIVAEFGGAYLGVAIPGPAQQQFQAGEPWDITHTSADRDIEGGHCVPLVGYDENFGVVVTWGQLQKVTWRWFAYYLTEAWAVLSSEDGIVDLAALQADLSRIK